MRVNHRRSLREPLTRYQSRPMSHGATTQSFGSCRPDVVDGQPDRVGDGRLDIV